MEAFTYPSFFLDHVYFQQVGEISTTSSCFTSYNSSDAELIPTPQASSENRKNQSTDHGSCLTTGKSKGAKGSKSRQQKKAMNDESKIATNEEPPLGYIHVRARRGQATDSHSIAERVRRERISERMKKLQGLVPGCDKVTGKALVLDEIINYVQSLQNQVEFLSMKLASSNPVVYDFSADYDELMNQQEEMRSMSQPIPSVLQHTPPTSFEGATNNFQAVDSSVPFSLQGQGPNNLSENGGSLLMQVGGHTTRGFANQVAHHNMCSFH